ncbi:helicase-related protein [Puia sp. P3]|uniref:helicase-related protein n=1 Tax=Puia sp. P3 TaxID=3423952 RepID=UPI003D677D23
MIFSQFLGMLALIKERLKELAIPFEYFDGSTTAIERERAIQAFQNDDTCRVFLISLKAGGVGLNLTAADYVYIVDPSVEPCRGTTGHRPDPPYRSDQEHFCLPHDL